MATRWTVRIKTGILHRDGIVSMGRHAPGTAQADWFICVGDMSYLDADAKQPGFAAFGHVISGMDVTRKILGLPTRECGARGDWRRAYQLVR